MTNSSKILDILGKERELASTELRAYSEFLFKVLPVSTTLVIAVAGVSATEGRAALMVAVPFLVSIVCVVLIVLNTMMQVLDGYLRFLEKATNKLLGIEVLFKNKDINGWIWGVGGSSGYCWELFSVLVVMLLSTGALYAFSVSRSLDYLVSQSTSDFITVGYLILSLLTPAVLVVSFFSLRSRLDSLIVKKVEQVLSRIERPAAPQLSKHIFK